MSGRDPQAGHRAEPAARGFGLPLAGTVLVLLLPALYLYDAWAATAAHCRIPDPSLAIRMCASDKSQALPATALVAVLPALGAALGVLRAPRDRARARAAAVGAFWASLIPLAAVLAMIARVLSQL